MPIASQNASNDVEQATEIIRRFNMEMNKDEMSTTVKGELSNILGIIDALYTEMDNAEKQFRLDVDLLSSKAYS